MFSAVKSHLCPTRITNLFISYIYTSPWALSTALLPHTIHISVTSIIILTRCDDEQRRRRTTTTLQQEVVNEKGMGPTWSPFTVDWNGWDIRTVEYSVELPLLLLLLPPSSHTLDNNVYDSGKSNYTPLLQIWANSMHDERRRWLPVVVVSSSGVAGVEDWKKTGNWFIVQCLAVIIK